MSSTNQKIDFLIADFDLCLKSGMRPLESFIRALEDYAEVFYPQKENKGKLEGGD